MLRFLIMEQVKLPNFKICTGFWIVFLAYNEVQRLLTIRLKDMAECEYLNNDWYLLAISANKQYIFFFHFLSFLFYVWHMLYILIFNKISTQNLVFYSYYNKLIVLKQKKQLKETIMNRFRKYGLFAWYSIIGTGVDWVCLKFLSTLFRGIIFIIMIVTFSYDGDTFNTLIKHSCAVSNVLSYAIGVAVTFVLSVKYAFKIKDNMPDRITNTVLIHFLGLLVQGGLFAVLIHNGFDENPAKIITICENAVLMGAGNIFIVFRNYKKDNSTKKQKKVSETWVFSSLIYGYFFPYIERSFFICLIPSSRNHVTLPM